MYEIEAISFPDRADAEKVLDSLFQVISQYGYATVTDLYGACGVTSNYQDARYGWRDLRGSGIKRIRDGFELDLPDPILLTEEVSMPEHKKPLREIWSPEVVNKTISNAAVSVAGAVAVVIVVKHSTITVSRLLTDISWAVAQKKLWHNR